MDGLAKPRAPTTLRSQFRSPERRTLWLTPIPPFRLDLTVWALRRRPDNIVDRWDGQCYRRVLALGGRPFEIVVTQFGTPRSPRLRIQYTPSGDLVNPRHHIQAIVERLLGTKANLKGLYRLAKSQPQLGQLVRRFRGLKPPRFANLFECLLNAMACQQISLSVGMLLLNRLIRRCGARLRAADGFYHAFPSPGEVAALTPGALRRMGFSRQKARSILNLSRAVEERKIDLEGLERAGNDSAIAKLRALSGVGRWTAEYALLRGLGRWNVFPGDDVGAWNNLQVRLRLRKRPDYQRIRRLLAPWREYTGLVYFHLLLDGLAEKGFVE